MTISGSYSIILPGMEKEVYLGVQAGIKIPSGVTDAVNPAGQKAEVTIQPGTGSWDAVMGLNFSYPLFTFGTPFSESYSTIPLIFGMSYQMPSKGLVFLNHYLFLAMCNCRFTRMFMEFSRLRVIIFSLE